MSARFKKLLYFIYAGTPGATAFIGFPVGQLGYVSAFRDSLCEEITKETGYKHKKTTGVYEDVDIHLYFFEDKDSEIIDAFYSKPYPGCWAWIFRTRYYRAYTAEQEKIEPLLKIEIATSHDFNGIAISKSIFTEAELARLITKVAQDLNLQISQGHDRPIQELIMSNRTIGNE